MPTKTFSDLLNLLEVGTNLLGIAAPDTAGHDETPMGDGNHYVQFYEQLQSHTFDDDGNPDLETLRDGMLLLIRGQCIAQHELDPATGKAVDFGDDED